jgi:hypothetical protein
VIKDATIESCDHKPIARSVSAWYSGLVFVLAHVGIDNQLFEFDTKFILHFEGTQEGFGRIAEVVFIGFEAGQALADQFEIFFPERIVAVHAFEVPGIFQGDFTSAG